MKGILTTVQALMSFLPPRDHFTASVVSFANGQSAVAKAAYNGCTQMLNERDGRDDHDYGAAGELAFSGVLAPKNPPSGTRP